MTDASTFTTTSAQNDDRDRDRDLREPSPSAGYRTVFTVLDAVDALEVGR